MDTEDGVGTVSAKLTRIICGCTMTCRMWTSATIGGSVTLIWIVTTTIKNAACRWKQCQSYILSPVVVSTTAFHTPQVIWVCWSSKVVFTLATHSTLSIQRSTQEIFKINNMFWKGVVQCYSASMIAVVRASSYYKPCRIIWHAKASQQICLSWLIIALHYATQVTSTLTTAIITRYRPQWTVIVCSTVSCSTPCMQ